MPLRMNVINAVFRRNFRSYFSGVIGYLFIVLFVALGAALAFSPQFFANNLANLDQLNAKFPILLLFFVPAITMSVWSDERKQGTDELLFTLPASDLEILLGKYLAVLGVYTVALLFSLSHVIVLMFLGDPDPGLIFTTYFGYWFTGAALLSAGMVASILTSSNAVAYVLGAVICAIPVFIDQPFPNNRLLQGLSVSEQFRDFGLGMIPIGGLIYFASFTALMLYLNLVLISRRHWSGGPQQTPMWAHYIVRVVAVELVLISANAIAANATRRIDMTTEKLYSLSTTTKRVLQSLKADRPVLIQAFISPEVPREYVSTRTSLIGLLRQFDQAGGDNLRVRIVSTEKFTDAADEARRYGIDAQEIGSDRGGRFVRDDVYLGIVVTGSVDDQVVIPFFDKGTPVEYELTRSIRTVSEADRKTVGILKTDAQIGGGFDMQAFRALPEWRIVTELKKQYEVKQVSPEQLADGGFDVLLAVMPSSLTDPEAESLVEAIQRGLPTLIVDDPFPRFHLDLAPRTPKPKPGGMGGMFGGGGQSPPKADNGEATKLCNALGIAWNTSETVWDEYDSHPDIREQLNLYQLSDVVYINPANKAKYAFNPGENITKGLQEVMLFYPGQIKQREGSKLKFEPLMRSSQRSVTYLWDEITRPGPMGGIGALIEPPKKELPDPISPVIAARLSGKASRSSEKPGDDDKPAAKPRELNVVFVADMDMIANPFFQIRDKETLGLRLDNVTFILNAVDELAGDDAFLELRSRRARHQTLTQVEARSLNAKARETEAAAKAENEAKEALDAAQKRFSDEVERIRDDTTLDARTKRIKIEAANANQSQRLAVEQAGIKNDQNKKVKAIKNQTERDVRQIEDRYRWLAIALPPVPALLLGIFVFAVRARDERQGVIPDRLVGKPAA
ncbi:MAG: ABC transporter permease [Planctomycetaceae bacterium]|nr:ABC transporter permease [Planctomycetaceae bacterium]